MLFLDKKGRKSHFDSAYTLRIAALIPVALFVFFIFKDGFYKLGTNITICVVMSFVFLLTSYLVFKSQQTKLKFTSFDTGLSTTDSYALSKKTLEILQWTVKEDTPGFIEAYNPHRDIRTWGNEMISIVILDGKILINSICNLDFMNQSHLTFGKNEENVAKFKETFQFYSKKKEKQSV